MRVERTRTEMDFVSGPERREGKPCKRETFFCKVFFSHKENERILSNQEKVANKNEQTDYYFVTSLAKKSSSR